MKVFILIMLFIHVVRGVNGFFQLDENSKITTRVSLFLVILINITVVYGFLELIGYNLKP